MKKEILVFVYGTLKKGFHNHHLLEGRGEYVGKYKTKKCLSLFETNLPFPFMVEEVCETGVTGELYRVDLETLKDLDRLEGHPHFYQRTLIELEGFNRAVYGYLHPKTEDMQLNKNGEFVGKKIRA